MILIVGMWSPFWRSISVSLLFAVFPFYFSFGAVDETFLATLFLTMSQLDLKFSRGKNPINFFCALLSHSSIGFIWPLQNYVSLCRGFSKLKSFVHILVGRGLSALSISYILSSGNFEIIKTSGIFVSYLMTDTFF